MGDFTWKCGVLGWLSGLRSFSFSTFLLGAQNDLSCPHAAAWGALASPPALVLVCDRARPRCWDAEMLLSVGHLGLSSNIPLCYLGKELCPNLLHFPLAAGPVCATRALQPL